MSQRPRDVHDLVLWDTQAETAKLAASLPVGATEAAAAGSSHPQESKSAQGAEEEKRERLKTKIKELEKLSEAFSSFVADETVPALIKEREEFLQDQAGTSDSWTSADASLGPS